MYARYKNCYWCLLTLAGKLDFDIKMRSRIILSCLLAQASFSVASAQEAEPAESVKIDSEAPEVTGKVSSIKSSGKVVADYGSAFERLVKLGLPDSKGAKYVKLTLHGEAGKAAQMRQYQYGQHSMGSSVKLGAKGNAWLLPDRKGEEGLANLIHSEYETVRVKKKQKRGGLMRLLVGPEKESKVGVAAGDWTDQDALADANQILKSIDEQSASGRVFQADRWGYSDDEAKWCAGILVQACHLYRAGFTKEANMIADKLLGLAPEPVRVIDHVVNNLAQRQYNLLAENFFKDKDWEAYRDGSKKLLVQFTRGWKSSEGVEVLVQQLDKRIKGAKPELKQLKGVSLNAEAVTIMDGLLAQEKPVVVDVPMCWILGDEILKQCSSNPNVGYYLKPSKQKWVKEMSGIGMDGLIALAAAVSDDSLMAAKMGQNENDYSSYSGMRFSSRSGGDDAATAQYAALKRPCSRGEIARKMLERTLPDAENELSSMSSSEVQAIAYQWWLKHRSDSPPQLVRHFFKEGNSQQQMIALVALMKSGDDGDAKVVEEFILKNEEPDEQTQMVTLYLKEKKGKAKPFFVSYSKILKEYTADLDEDEIDWQIRQAGGVDKFLKKLEVYVKNISPDKILADMRSGKLKGKEGLGMLKIVLPDGEIVKHLPAIVNIARHQKIMKEQIELLDEMSKILSQEYYEKYYNQEKPAEGDKEYEKYLTTLIEPSKEDWQYFLSQTELVKDRDHLNGAPSLAAYIGWTIENLYFPQHQRSFYALNQIMNTDELWQFGIKRSAAVMKEGAQAYFPDPKNVKEERRLEIRQKLKPMSSDDILSYHKELSLDERLAWADVLKGFGEQLPKGVSGLRKRVVKVNWPSLAEKDKSLKQKLDDLVQGEVVDQVMLDALLDFMLGNAQTHHDLATYIQSAGENGFGFVVQVSAGRRATQIKQTALLEVGEDLREGKTKKLAAMFVYGDRGASSAYKREPVVAEDADKRKKIMEGFLNKVNEGKAAYMIFISETSENFIKRKAAEE